jgi:hypothetical protein
MFFGALAGERAAHADYHAQSAHGDHNDTSAERNIAALAIIYHGDGDGAN